MPPSPKIKSLEGLRGLCALIVVLGHILVAPEARSFAAAHPLFGSVALALAGSGAPAVLVFFVLSGYVMAHRYRSPFDGAALREYLWRRWLRLWPIMLVAVGLGVLAERGAPAGVVLGNLLFLHGLLVPTLPGDIPLWTLTYEVVYYLIFGFVMRGWLPRGTMPFLSAVGIVAIWFSSWTGFQIMACGIFWWLGYWLARNEGRSTRLSPVLDQNTSLRAAGLLMLGLVWHFAGVVNPAARLAGASEPMVLNDVLGAPLFLAIVCETLGYRLWPARWLWALVALGCLPRFIYQWHDPDSAVTFRRWIGVGELALSWILLAAAQTRWPRIRLERLSALGAISYALYVLHWPMVNLAWSAAAKLPTAAQTAGVVLSGYLAVFVASWILEKYYQKAWHRAFKRLMPAKTAAASA